MVKKLLLLCSVAFCVSFGLSLLVKRDIKIALLTGLINVPATFLGLIVVRAPSSRTSETFRKQKGQQKRKDSGRGLDREPFSSSLAV